MPFANLARIFRRNKPKYFFSFVCRGLVAESIYIHRPDAIIPFIFVLGIGIVGTYLLVCLLPYLTLQFLVL